MILDDIFGIEPGAELPELIEGVDYIAHPHVKVPPVNADDLRKFEKDPENLKRRGRAISKGKKGNKVRPFSAQAKANIAAAVKKRWAEGSFKRKTQPRDAVTGKFIGSKK